MERVLVRGLLISLCLLLATGQTAGDCEETNPTAVVPGGGFNVYIGVPDQYADEAWVAQIAFGPHLTLDGVGGREFPDTPTAIDSVPGAGEDPSIFPLSLHLFAYGNVAGGWTPPLASKWVRGDVGHFLPMTALVTMQDTYTTFSPVQTDYTAICSSDHAGGLRAHACDAPRYFCGKIGPSDLDFACSEHRVSINYPSPLRKHPYPQHTDTIYLNNPSAVQWRMDNASFVDIFDATPDEIPWQTEDLRGALYARFVRLPAETSLGTITDLGLHFSTVYGTNDWRGAKIARFYDVGACSIVVRWVDMVDAIHYALRPHLTQLMTMIAEQRFENGANAAKEWFVSHLEIDEALLGDRAVYAPIFTPSYGIGPIPYFETEDKFIVRWPVNLEIESRLGNLFPLRDPQVRPVFTMRYPESDDRLEILGEEVFPFFTPEDFHYTVENLGSVVNNDFGAAEVEDTAEAVLAAITLGIPWALADAEPRLLKPGVQLIPVQKVIDFVAALQTFLENNPQFDLDMLFEDPANLAALLPPDLRDDAIDYATGFRSIKRIQNRPEGIEFILAEWPDDPEFSALVSDHPTLCTRPQNLFHPSGPDRAGIVSETYAYYGIQTYLNDPSITARAAGLP